MTVHTFILALCLAAFWLTGLGTGLVFCDILYRKRGR